MPWKDVNRTRAAATAASAKKRRHAKELGVCWRCLPRNVTPVKKFTTCLGCRRRELARRASHGSKVGKDEIEMGADSQASDGALRP